MFYKNNNTLKKIIELSLYGYMILFLSTLFTNLNLLRYSIIVSSCRLVGLILILFSLLYFMNDNEKYYYKYKIHILFIIISLLSLISALISIDDYFALFGVRESSFGINYNDGYITMISYFGFFMGSFVLTYKSIERFINLFSYFSYLISIIGLFSKYIHKLFDISTIINIKTSLFFNSNHYGYFLTIALMVSIYNLLKKNKITHTFGYIILSLSLIYTNSRGALLAVIIALIAYIVLINVNKTLKTTYSYYPILLLLLSLISINIIDSSVSTTNRLKSVYNDANAIITNEENSERSGSGRWKLWKDGFILFTDKPILGQGINGVYYNVDSDESIFIRVHNEYLEYLFTYGILFFIIYITILLMIGLEFIKNINNKTLLELIIAISIFAYLISAFFGNTKPYTTPYFYILLGFLHTLAIKTKNSIEEQNA